MLAPIANPNITKMLPAARSLKEEVDLVPLVQSHNLNSIDCCWQYIGQPALTLSTQALQFHIPSTTMQLVFLTSLALATLASAYPKAAPDASTARRAVPAVPTHVTYGFGGAFISDSTANSNPTAKLFINNAHPNDWGDCIPFNHNTNSMRATTSIRCVFFKYVVGFAMERWGCS